PKEQRREQVSAKLGLPQSVSHRRERFSAQFIIQSHRAGGRARLLDRGSNQESVYKKSRPAGFRMMVRLTILVTATVILVTSVALAEGDPKGGKKIFKNCRACHTADGKANEVGPGLHGVFGRKAGERDDFRYSPALKRSGITWTPQTMD